jgi:uncharacterized membrane protein
MEHNDFLKLLDRDAIAAAVRAAEQQTSGELRVFISRDPTSDPVYAAELQFDELGMQQTRERNGVLIYVAPQSQNFAIVGDRGVHRLCGDSFWQEVAGAMEASFRASAFTQAILLGISEAGRLLAEKFPRQADDINELADDLAHH